VGSSEGPERPPDFFIGWAGADAPFAAEIGRILEDAGHTVVLQQWDFANRNFMERMDWALESAERVIALLSNEYLASDHCAAEWQDAIAHDPLNKQGRLIVLRVAEAAPTGLLTALAYWDLVPVRGDGALLRDIVLAAIKPGRHKDDGARAAQYWRAARPIVHPEIRATPSFTGREAALSSLHGLLWAGHTAAVTQPVAAYGLGGIGKSVLAREYAHRNQDDYAGVWWLNAAKPEDGTPGFEGVKRALVELGAIFIRGLDQAQDRAKAARQTLDLIAHGGFDKPWLLVYDNVDDARVLREWAPAGNSHVLVTSRLSGWPNTVKPIEIEEWALPDAIRYLRQESGRSDLTEGDAAEIAETLGRLPLALSHAAALLRARPNITAAGYLASLTRRMNEAPSDAEYPRAVFATFKEVFAEAEHEARGAGAVISLAAFFAPDDIPEELFAQPPECYPPALAELLAIPGGMDDAIGALAHLSLVDFHAGKRTFSVHRLVQAAAWDALGDEARAWSNSALRAVRSAFPEPEFRTWPRCERLVAHVRAVAAHVTEDSGALAWLLGTTGTYLQERAALAEVLPLYERTRSILEGLTHADPGNARWQRDLSVAHEKIGNVLVAQGDLSGALERYRISLGIRDRLGQADPGNVRWQYDLGISHERMGDALMAQGKLAEALRSYESRYQLISALAEQDPGNAGWQRDLSVAQEKIGDVERARSTVDGALQAYEDSLAIREKLAAQDPGNAEWQRPDRLECEACRGRRAGR
jgi:tetratricopeptide (TPR) repeat protein